MFRAKVSLLVSAALAWAGFDLRLKCRHLVLLATLTACGARTDLGSADALTDAGNAIDAPSPPDAAACSIVGTWEFTYWSSHVFDRFLATGQHYEDPTLAGVESAAPTWSSPYTFAAGLVTFNGGPYGCYAAYSLTFDAACDRADARMVTDTCTAILDVPYTMTRVP
jgi:hypothetical protein